eukprot:12241544-Alexandrium_andersonii.AAC.1
MTVDAHELGWAASRKRQVILMFSKAFVQDLSHHASLAGGVAFEARLRNLETVFRVLFHRQALYTWE